MSERIIQRLNCKLSCRTTCNSLGSGNAQFVDLPANDEKSSSATNAILASAKAAGIFASNKDLALSECGNPVMTLVAFLTALIAPDAVATSAQTERKVLLDHASALQLADENSFPLELVEGGLSPIGAQDDTLAALTKDILYSHVKAIKKSIPNAFPPWVQLDLRKEVFALGMEAALGLTGYVRATPNLQSEQEKRLVACLLAVECGKADVIRTFLYDQKDHKLRRGMTVAQVTDQLSDLLNKLGKR